MRIIAGRFGGRLISSPKKHSTHPMSEKIRGALFNTLGELEGLSVFDAYAGSGALGLEAISRGAKSVVFCDIDRQAVTTIRKNTKILAVDLQSKIIQANCVTYIRENPQKFDIIIADPPYNDVKISHLVELADCLSPNGVFVLSLPPSVDISQQIDLELLRSKIYGDASLYFYRPKNL